MKNYVRAGKPMRGVGATPDYCSSDFVGPVSPEQISTCAIAYRDDLLAQQSSSPGFSLSNLFTNMPTWFVPATVGLLLLSFMKGRR